MKSHEQLSSCTESSQGGEFPACREPGGGAGEGTSQYLVMAGRQGLHRGGSVPKC